MDVFPAFIPLGGARVAVVGEGHAAEAKAALFAGSPAEVVRIGPAAAADESAYRGARLAFIALETGAVEAAARAAHAAGALVNVVDRPDLCDFHTPSIVDRGPVVGAVGTGGAAPVLATLLRSEIEARWPDRLGALAALSAELQQEVRAALPALPARRAYWRRMLGGPAGEAALQGDVDLARRLAREALEHPPEPGRVLFLDPPARSDLLTLAAVRALSDADRIVAFEGAPEAVLAFARRDAERSGPVDAARLAAWAERGLSVVCVGAGSETPAAVEALGAPIGRLPAAR